MHDWHFQLSQRRTWLRQCSYNLGSSGLANQYARIFILTALSNRVQTRGNIRLNVQIELHETLVSHFPRSRL